MEMFELIKEYASLPLNGVLLLAVISLWRENGRLKARAEELEDNRLESDEDENSNLTLEGAMGMSREGSPRRGVSGRKPPRLPPAN